MKGINLREKNGNWKGGRHLTPRGYVKISSREHARADKDGYVFEHIVLMEAYLGRELEPGEVVHHKNGLKDDNRLENLELFKTHSEHMRQHRVRSGKDVTCDNCGRAFYKGRSRLSKYNFCSQSCVRPILWNSRWGNKKGRDAQ